MGVRYDLLTPGRTPWAGRTGGGRPTTGRRRAAERDELWRVLASGCPCVRQGGARLASAAPGEGGRPRVGSVAGSRRSRGRALSLRRTRVDSQLSGGPRARCRGCPPRPAT